MTRNEENEEFEEFFSNCYLYNSTYDADRDTSKLEHHAILQKQDIACVSRDPRLRFAITQLLRTYDLAQRLRILAQFSVDEQLALLSVCAKKQYKHRVLTKHNYNKLSKAEKQKIRELRAKNISYAEIARQLNRHVSTIYYYCKRNNL